jgi:hypothetical protein
MKQRGIPLTRQNYLALAFPDGLPKGLMDYELEELIPEEIRLGFSKAAT